MHVMIIEQNEKKRTDLERFSLKTGFEVSTAINLSNAMDLLSSSHRIDIILGNHQTLNREDLQPFFDTIDKIRKHRSYLFLLIDFASEDLDGRLASQWQRADAIIFSADDVRILGFQLKNAARITALENELNQKYITIKNNYYQTIDAFEQLIANYDDKLGKHCRRVGRLALTLAKRHSEIKASEYPLIEAAGRLHDIGFFGLPKALIGLDRVEMSGEQFQQYRGHCEYGAKILSCVDMLKPVATIVRQHHEQFNGRGFPDGLHREKISLNSQIVSAASLYDHLAKVKRISDQLLIDRLQQFRGYQLSPILVDLLLDFHLEEINRIKKQSDHLIALDQLKEGMVLSRDIIMKSGANCMAAGNKLDHSAIEKLKDYYELGNINDEVFISK